MGEFLQTNGGIIGTVVLVATIFNMVLSGVGKALDLVKDKTATQADNKVAEWILKIATILQKVIDWTSANRAHK